MINSDNHNQIPERIDTLIWFPVRREDTISVVMDIERYVYFLAHGVVRLHPEHIAVIPLLLRNLGDLYAESGQTLQGSFSAVSKPNLQVNTRWN